MRRKKRQMTDPHRSWADLWRGLLPAERRTARMLIFATVLMLIVIVDAIAVCVVLIMKWL